MMKKLGTTLLLFALGSVSALAADFNGKWTGDVPGRNGNTQTLTFSFHVDGAALTGKGFRPPRAAMWTSPTAKSTGIIFRPGAELQRQFLHHQLQGRCRWRHHQVHSHIRRQRRPASARFRRQKGSSRCRAGSSVAAALAPPSRKAHTACRSSSANRHDRDPAVITSAPASATAFNACPHQLITHFAAAPNPSGATASLRASFYEYVMRMRAAKLMLRHSICVSSLRPPRPGIGSRTITS